MSKNITIFHQAFESGGGAGKELVKQVLAKELNRLWQQKSKCTEEDKEYRELMIEEFGAAYRQDGTFRLSTLKEQDFFKQVALLIRYLLQKDVRSRKFTTALYTFPLLKKQFAKPFPSFDDVLAEPEFIKMCMLQDWSSLDKKPKQSLVKAFLQQVVEKYKQPDIIALGEYEYKEQLDGYKMTRTENAYAVRAMSVFVRNDRNSELKAKLLHIGNLEECIAVDNILFLHSPNDNGIPGKVLDAISGIKPDLAKLAGDLAKLAGDLEQYKVFIGDFNFPSNTNSKNLVIRKASQASSLSDPGAEKINKKIQAFKKKIQAFKKSANVGVVTRSDLTTEKIIPDGDTSGAYPVINHTDNKYYLMGNHRGFCVELVRTVKRPREEDPDDNSGVSATPTKKSKKDK